MSDHSKFLVQITQGELAALKQELADALAKIAELRAGGDSSEVPFPAEVISDNPEEIRFV